MLTGIDLRLNTKAVGIDQASIKPSPPGQGDVLKFLDKLILATGSYAFVRHQYPGNDRQNCFVYRTIRRCGCHSCCQSDAKTGVVIGGGLLGLEAAKALRDLNLETHVRQNLLRVSMAVQIDDLGGQVLAL